MAALSFSAEVLRQMLPYASKVLNVTPKSFDLPKIDVAKKAELPSPVFEGKEFGSCVDEEVLVGPHQHAVQAEVIAISESHNSGLHPISLGQASCSPLNQAFVRYEPLRFEARLVFKRV